jgi:RNA polymerase sigma-70 factor (ECF subfamily)
MVLTDGLRSRAELDECADGKLAVMLRDKGNIMAFEVLLRRYQAPIFGFIMRQVGDRQKAEDLFQETFLRVYHRIDTCRKPDSFKPWAFTIAANLCRNETRRQQVRQGEQPEERVNGFASSDPGPDGAAEAGETRRRITEALEQLPAAQREVFILYHYTHLSYDEIAEVLETPVGTIKSRMNAALKALRQLLAELRQEG